LVTLDEVEGGIVTRFEILEQRSQAWAGGSGAGAPSASLRPPPTHAGG
jgi:hypothetical protein